MADKRINELTAASTINDDDLLVISQNDVAKKISGVNLRNGIAALMQGHGGIVSIAKTATSALTDTYTITLDDGTKSTFSVTNGKQGDKGAPFTYDDFTPEQLAELKGEPGDKMTFADLTEEDKAELKGAPFVYSDFTEEQLAELKGDKGDPLTFDDLTDYQKEQLRGEPLTFDMLTEDEKAELKGEPGENAEPYGIIVNYGESQSATVYPSQWFSDISSLNPATGSFVWTRMQFTDDSDSVVKTAYSVSHIGKDGTGAGSVTTVTFGGKTYTDTAGDVSIPFPKPDEVGAIAAPENPGNGQILAYDSVAGEWVPASPVAGVQTVNGKGVTVGTNNIQLTPDDIGAYKLREDGIPIEDLNDNVLPAAMYASDEFYSSGVDTNTLYRPGLFSVPAIHNPDRTVFQGNSLLLSIKFPVGGGKILYRQLAWRVGTLGSNDNNMWMRHISQNDGFVGVWMPVNKTNASMIRFHDNNTAKQTYDRTWSDIYISASKGDDSNPGTEEKPFKTIDKMYRLIDEGATNIHAYLDGGSEDGDALEYSTNYTINTGINIHLAGYGTKKPKITFNNGGVSYQCRLNFDGIELTSKNDNSWYTDNSFVRFKNCIINSPYVCYGGGLYMDESTSKKLVTVSMCSANFRKNNMYKVLASTSNIKMWDCIFDGTPDYYIEAADGTTFSAYGTIQFNGTPTSGKIINSCNAVSNPNMLINSRFNIAQAGYGVAHRNYTTSGTITSVNYACDAWRRDGAMQVSKVDDYMLCTNVNGGGATSAFYQAIENPEKYSGMFTVSAIVEAESGSNTKLGCYGTHADGQDNQTADYALVGTGKKQFISHTFNMKSGSHLRFLLRFTGKVYAVKMERGNVSTLLTDPEPTYAEDLSKCLRYFYRLKSNGDWHCITTQNADDATSIYASIPLPVPMYVSPTVTMTANTLYVGKTSASRTVCTALAASDRDDALNTAKAVKFTSSGMTAGTPYMVMLKKDAYIDFSADMYW